MFHAGSRKHRIILEIRSPKLDLYRRIRSVKASMLDSCGRIFSTMESRSINDRAVLDTYGFSRDIS